MKFLELKMRLIAPWVVVCFLAGVGSQVAKAQVPTSGARLDIDGTVTYNDVNAPVHLKVYDSQIQTGVVQVPALPATSPASTCTPTDEIPTDGYLLQAAAPTGCDQGDSAEANLTTLGSFKFMSPTGSPVAYEFDITTQYVCSPAAGGAGSACNATPKTNTNGNIFSNDTGFLTVTNNVTPGSTFSGTVKLSGQPGNSINCGPALLTDTVSSGLSPGASAVLALSADASSCGGFNAAQTLTLTAGMTSTFTFGNDAYKITPFNSNAGDTLTLLPVPVPAGPLGLNTWGAGNFGSDTSVFLSPLRFSATNFPGQACLPYLDFSAVNNPVCPEINLTCTPGADTVNDCPNFLYSAEDDVNIDTNSLPNGVGGVRFLGDTNPADQCPTTAFNTDVLFSYTGGVTDPPIIIHDNPLGCFAATFDPTAAPVPAGVTVTQDTFEGFFLPVIDSTPNHVVFNTVKVGGIAPLIWETEDSSGHAITNLHLCKNMTGSGCTNPWVFLGFLPIDCTTGAGLQGATITTDKSFFNVGLLHLVGAFYAFPWQTVSPGCVTQVLMFSTGLTSFGVGDFKVGP